VSTAGPGGPERDADSTAVLPPTVADAADRHVTPPTSSSDSLPIEPPRTQQRRSRTRRIATEWTLLIVAALAIAFLIKTFLFQAFYIPSGSMEPTLKIGDRVLVNKLSYDLHDVNRGDIVVFEKPPGANIGDVNDLVKRVIGLPGDTVTYPGDGHVYVNGRRLKEPYLPAGVDTCFNRPGDTLCATGASTTTTSSQQGVVIGCTAPANGENGCVVPNDRLLVMGDNREHSSDSRSWGVIKESSIVGRVFLRIWPIGHVGFL